MPAPQQRRHLGLESAGGWLSSCYASCLASAPVTSLASQLCALHDASGLPWWGVVAGATVALRAGMLMPAHVTAQKVRKG